MGIDVWKSRKPHSSEHTKNPGNCANTRRSKVCVHQLRKKKPSDMHAPIAAESISFLLKRFVIMEPLVQNILCVLVIWKTGRVQGETGVPAWAIGLYLLTLIINIRWGWYYEHRFGTSGSQRVCGGT